MKNQIPFRVPDEEYARRIAALDRMEEIRDRAIAAGMTLLTMDEINAEVHRRRYGDESDD